MAQRVKLESRNDLTSTSSRINELGFNKITIALIPKIVEYDVSTSTGYGVSSSLSNTAYSVQLINTEYPLPLDMTMTKVIKGEFNKIMDIKVKDDSLAYDSPLKVFNYEHEADDMGFDPSDIAFTEWLGSKFFNYKIIDHYTMKALWIYWIRGDDEYEALEDSEPKDEALRNKAIMEGFIKDDDDESSYEQMRQWDIYTNYDDTYKTNHDGHEREELCEVHEPLVCTTQRFEIIKYSCGQGEEYVAIKEDEYDNLARTSNNACRTYQEIFCMMDEGWMMDLVKEISMNIGEEFTNLKILKYLIPTAIGFIRVPEGGNNVVPLRSDTIRLVQNGCSFHGLRSEDPNQHLKDFLKLVDSLDLDGENRERTRLRLFQFSIRDQASNWLERLPAGSISTWEDLTTRFLA
ncbi:hypothetical protein Tco_0025158 [Tanacetum coccineum]